VFTSRPLFTTDGFVPETDIIILEPVRHDDDVVVADDRDTAEEDEEEEDEEEEDEEEEDEEEEDEEEEDEEEEDEEEPAVPVREQVFSADKQFVFSSVPERYTIIVAGNKRAAMEQVETEISIQALKAVAARYNNTTFSVFAQSEKTVRCGHLPRVSSRSRATLCW
jgi:ABC-type Zn2+ transport system substrate-binding protein/surface adhesin